VKIDPLKRRARLGRRAENRDASPGRLALTFDARDARKMTKPSNEPIGTPEPFELCTRLFISSIEEFAKNSLADGKMPPEQAEEVELELSRFHGEFDDLAQLIEPLRATPHDLRAAYQSLMGVMSGAFTIGTSINMTPEAWRRFVSGLAGLVSGQKKHEEAEAAKKLYGPLALKLAQKIWSRNSLSQLNLAFKIISQWDAEHGIPKDIECPTVWQLQELIKEAVRDGNLQKRKRLAVKPVQLTG
jgi:hypothetical protein